MDIYIYIWIDWGSGESSGKQNPKRKEHWVDKGVDISGFYRDGVLYG